MRRRLKSSDLMRVAVTASQKEVANTAAPGDARLVFGGFTSRPQAISSPLTAAPSRGIGAPVPAAKASPAPRPSPLASDLQVTPCPQKLKRRALCLGTSARSARWAQRCDGTKPSARLQNDRSMPLGTIQDTGKALARPFDRRVTHDGHGKTAKAAEEALRAQNGLSAEAPLRPNWSETVR